MSKRVAPHESVLLTDGAPLIRSQLDDLSVVAKGLFPFLFVCFGLSHRAAARLPAVEAR
eukprot:CAMPEP_0119073032 /NCGR_PEP_ID=MMETSP1178-20130426/61760_1 /TAXON_ID=33656 /ORGANISM="unid sp, Strain CCMP2000" /LENGTH=58 /DNA_ID=CAMNT_0007055091 /DNA_START=88 /DNA_END=264 /DNA_ORIENTATION=-